MEVRFTYDINGLLEVEATVCSTGHTHRLLIEQAPGVLSPEEIAERLRVLAALKIPPREQKRTKPRWHALSACMLSTWETSVVSLASG